VHNQGGPAAGVPTPRTSKTCRCMSYHSDSQSPALQGWEVVHLSINAYKNVYKNVHVCVCTLLDALDKCSLVSMYSTTASSFFDVPSFCMLCLLCAPSAVLCFATYTSQSAFARIMLIHGIYMYHYASVMTSPQSQPVALRVSSLHFVLLECLWHAASVTSACGTHKFQLPLFD